MSLTRDQFEEACKVASEKMRNTLEKAFTEITKDMRNNIDMLKNYKGLRTTISLEKRCSKCGKEFHFSDNFCSFCGNPRKTREADA